jgi:hypothetical protein
MTKQKEILKKRIVIPISGDVLKVVMDLRAIKERESGIPTSLTAIVKAAIMAQRNKEAVLAVERFERGESEKAL